MDEADAEQLSLAGLVRLLVSANEPAVGYSGVLAEHESGYLRSRWRVWRLGKMARIEDPPGRLSLLAGTEFYWRSWPVDEGLRRISRDPDDPPDFDLSRLMLLDPQEYWTAWLACDQELVMDTLHRTEHQGRPAWRFTAPRVEEVSPDLTVDLELGLVVRAETRTGRFPADHLVEWSDLQLDPSLDAAFFDHDT